MCPPRASRACPSLKGQEGLNNEEPSGCDLKDEKEKARGGGGGVGVRVPEEVSAFEELAGLSLLWNGQVGAHHPELWSLK